MLNNLNLMKRYLDKKLETEDVSDKEILKISEEVDELILDYYHQVDTSKTCDPDK